jgi:hypothetical protein
VNISIASTKSGATSKELRQTCDVTRGLGIRGYTVPVIPLRPSMRTDRMCWVHLIGFLLESPWSGQAQEPYFPDSMFIPKNKALNAIVHEHLTLQLKAMNEPSLWKLGSSGRSARRA